ncbi:MAG: hypothetical protein M1150_02465 [Patescibacteria group bacterium]|nr:hypothetical protein [Patescibacteria group bacterium]
MNLIEEEEASLEVKATYLEIKDTLGVFDVGVLFKALALQPDLLKVIWQALKPNAASFALAKDAELLKQEALEGTGKIYHPYDYWPQIIDSQIPRSLVVEVDNQLTFYLYLTSRLLLLNTVLEKMSDGEAVGAMGLETEEFTKESPYREALVYLVSPNQSKRITEVFEDIKTTLIIPVIDDPYRALANWFEYLVVAWGDLRPFTETGDYRKEEERIFFLASSLAKELPFEVKVSKKRLVEAGEIIKPLRRVFLTSLLNVSAFKVALDRAVI